MIQTLITMVIAIIAGIILGIVEILMNNKKRNTRRREDVSKYASRGVIGKELIQRRGSWRFALDQILFSDLFDKQIQDEANIKVH